MIADHSRSAPPGLDPVISADRYTELAVGTSVPAVRVFGAIMAGGRSRRFGTDKADALWNGATLIARCAAALAPQVDALAICGRSWNALECLSDRPAPGLGPLGAINAALHHAAARGFGAVLAVPVDVHPLPDTLRALLEGDRPAVFDRQTAIGWWPVGLAARLDAHIASGARSIESWVTVAQCRRIDDAALALVNVNRPEDLERLIRA